MLEVTEIKATEISVVCPHCNCEQYSWFGDPRGGVYECDDCGMGYKIHKEADIVMY